MSQPLTLRPRRPLPRLADRRVWRAVFDLVNQDLPGQQEAVRQRLAKAAAQKVVAHPSMQERQRRGRVARAEVPRERLAVWEPARTGRIRWSCWWGRRPRGCRSWCRCAMPGWPRVRSPSTAVLRW